MEVYITCDDIFVKNIKKEMVFYEILKKKEKTVHIIEVVSHFSFIKMIAPMSYLEVSRLCTDL